MSLVIRVSAQHFGEFVRSLEYSLSIKGLQQIEDKVNI